MSDCCPSSNPCACTSNATDACAQTVVDNPAANACRFDHMIQNCLAYTERAKADGKPIVGILCEFTPRELILAAGAVPVCLCGGSHTTALAAESVLPAGLCPLIKSTFGYHMQKNNPFLEMADLIVAETTCDGKKKMYELMAESRPVYILELPQKPDDPDSLALWRIELNKLKTKLEQQFNTKITDEKIRDAIELMNKERRLRRELAALMKRDNPPLTGRQLLNLKSSISGICEDLAEYQTILDKLGSAECCGETSSKNREVRVLVTGVPIAHGAERVVDLIEDNGGRIVAMENCTGLKPILDDVREDADPMEALAEKYFHLPCSVMTPNTLRFDMIEKLIDDYKPDCIVELIWQGCLTYEVEAALLKQQSEERFGLPYMKIVTDYAPADSQRIAVRLEALFEMVNTRPTAQPT